MNDRASTEFHLSPGPAGEVDAKDAFGNVLTGASAVLLDRAMQLLSGLIAGEEGLRAGGDAARIVLDVAVPGIEWVERRAGSTALAEQGDLLPEETLDAIRESRVAIKGPITTPVGSGFRSINVALRQELDLFAAVRPARSLPGVPTRHGTVDLVVIRENTEDLYQE